MLNTKIVIFLVLMMTPTDTEIVSNFVKDKLSTPWIAKRYPKRLSKALKLVPLIIEESEKVGVDPLLIAQIIHWETRWDPKAVGKSHGETGLMQMHGKARRMAAKRFDLSAPEGQIKGGIWWFGQGLKLCNGNVRQALNMYGHGSCKPVLRFAKIRYQRYRKAKTKYSKEAGQ